MKWLPAITLLLFFVSSTAGQDFRRSAGVEAFLPGTHDQTEYCARTDGTVPITLHNPDADERKRLVAEWGKAAMGYVDEPDDSSKGDEDWTTRWKDDNSLRADRELCIGGRLLIESADRKHRRPIDWVQYVRVIVSRLPEKKHDWSRRQKAGDAVWDDFVISSRGEFMVRVSPGEVCRRVGKDARFQVALSLDVDNSDSPDESVAPVLPQSVAMLKIPGPPAISKTMQIINGAPSYDQNDFNPAKLVRAVNYLMPMGKKKAIRELRTFLEIARDTVNETVRRDEDIDTSDRTCVFLIVHLLFESADPKEQLPDIWTVPFIPIPNEKDKKYWPLHPIGLQNDVPFFLVDGGGLGGVPDQPERHVDWAEKYGRIRTKLLRPIDNPMTAAERLVALPQTKRLYKGRIGETFKALLYRQAWNIIKDVDPRILKAKPVPSPDENEYEDRYWDTRAKAAAKFKIHWDEAAQRYIMK